MCRNQLVFDCLFRNVQDFSDRCVLQSLFPAHDEYLTPGRRQPFDDPIDVIQQTPVLDYAEIGRSVMSQFSGEFLLILVFAEFFPVAFFGSVYRNGKQVGLKGKSGLQFVPFFPDF